MKAGEAGGSMLLSALNACRARLRAFIRGRTSVRDDADDILQEVTYQLMKVEQPVENVAAWLFRAARNEMTTRVSRRTSWPKPCLAYRTRRRRSTSKRCCGKSWGRHCLNCRRRSGRCLKRPSSTATALKCWQRRPAPANRRCYPASIRRYCFCAPGCGTSMTH